MKFQRTPAKIKGQWAFEAQFNNRSAEYQVREWLSGRPSVHHELRGDRFFTNDIQVMVDLRLQFDDRIRSISMWEGALSGRS